MSCPEIAFGIPKEAGTEKGTAKKANKHGRDAALLLALPYQKTSSSLPHFLQ